MRPTTPVPTTPAATMTAPIKKDLNSDLVRKLFTYFNAAKACRRRKIPVEHKTANVEHLIADNDSFASFPYNMRTKLHRLHGEIRLHTEGAVKLSIFVTCRGHMTHPLPPCVHLSVGVGSLQREPAWTARGPGCRNCCMLKKNHSNIH